MNEFLIVFVILITLAISYLWIYPTFVGDNVKVMVWLDVFLSGIPLAVAAILFWVPDPVFWLFGFETNWFFFTLITMLIIEMPIFLLYLKARGLWDKYWALYSMAPSGSKDAGWSTASVKSVEKQLNDTKWDGLRTISAKRGLFWASHLVILFGTGFLLTVGDNAWAAYSLIHILLIFVMWTLVRQSVRLIADAPEEALDEMFLAKRNASYVVAFRTMAATVVGVLIALGTYVILADSAPDSDGFSYVLNFTWPQFQALFWFLMGYALMSPSLAMLSIELQEDRKRGKQIGNSTDKG